MAPAGAADAGAASRPGLRNRLAQLGEVVRLRARGGEAAGRARGRPEVAANTARRQGGRTATEDAYQAALAAVYRESEEDERRRAEAAEAEEEARYEAAMAQALALSAAGNSVVPPVAPPSPIKPEPQPEPEPIARFSWNGVVREWVSAPPVWLRATPAQEQAYLEMWR